jgi:hypothetical protein
MDPALLRARREEALSRITEGNALIAQQREFVSRCRNAGLSPGRAETLLRVLEAMKALHVDCLARIERELALVESRLD